MADHYALLADINAFVPQSPFTTTSVPTSTQVTAWIDDTANDMDAMLANAGYVVPVISGTKALQWLRRTCAFGVLAVAQDARSTGVKTAVSATGKEAENIWSQRYRLRMAALCDPQDPTELADAPRTNEQIEKQGDLVLRSMAQGITDDPNYSPDAPSVGRYQVL